MDDFAALECELTDAAKAGNVDHIIALLRDLGNLHHLWKPNSAQVVAIERATERCLRKAGGGEFIQPQDLQNPSSTEHAIEAVRAAPTECSQGCSADNWLQTGGERLIKGYMVSSVNEWGADQTRILLLTNEAVHRVKYSFQTESVVSWHSTPLSAILRVEYGNFKAASSSLTTFLWRKDIEDQQGFRIYTQERDGKKSINDVVQDAAATDAKAQQAAAAALEASGGVTAAAAAAAAERRHEYFREYRALLAEDEPWKEEVFMLEVVAALQAVKTLTRSKFDIRLTKMVKSLPGGLFTVLHNVNRRRQHGF